MLITIAVFKCSWLHVRQDASHHAGRRVRRYHEDSRPCAFPPRTRSRTLLPHQGTSRHPLTRVGLDVSAERDAGQSLHYQRVVDVGSPWECRPGQLCRRQVRSDRAHQDDRERVGSVWCARQHRGVRPRAHEVVLPTVPESVCAERTSRLTSSKEDGATIEIEGKKVALGIPAAQARAAESVNAYADIPLRRGASADEAAAAMLL